MNEEFERRSKSAIKGWITRRAKQKAKKATEKALKGWDTRRENQAKEEARAEKASQTAKKGWETRRENQEKASKKVKKSKSNVWLNIFVSILAFIIGFAGVVIGFCYYTKPANDVYVSGNLSFHFMELGNKYTGDCTYIKAGDIDILIDAGSRYDSASTIANYIDDYVTDGKIEYVIATHAHEDHIGAVAHFWPLLRCPVYVTAFAAEILEDRLDEAGLLGRVPVTVVSIGDALELGPFEIEFSELNHSIPESASLLIKTKYGSVFHTGDWKFDPEPVIGLPANEKSVKRLQKEKLLALIGDSTNVFVEDDGLSEADVRRSLTDIFARHETRRIVVTCFASNVGRMESIAYAAAQNNREVCLVGRSLWRIEGAGRAAGYFKDVPVFLTPDEARELPANRVIYVLTGCQGEPKAALSNLSYGVLNAVQLEPKDVVIFSSRTIPGNEQAIANIQNRFIDKRIKVG